MPSSRYDAAVRWLLCALALVGCGDNLGAGPALEITSPERGLITEATAVAVEGQATAQIAGVSAVEVNGQRVELDSTGRFRVELDLGPGTHRIVTTAIGKNGESTRDVRAVSLGQRAGAFPIAAGTVISIGTVGLGRVARARVLSAIDMASVYAAVSAAPIADRGTGCEQDVISVADMSTPIALVHLYGLLGGLGGELLFMPLETTMSADYADSGCNPATGTFDFETLELHMFFNVEIEINDGEATVGLINESRLYDHDLIISNVDIDAAVFTRVSAEIETHLADALIPAGADQFRAGMAAWIESFAATQTGPSIELTSSVSQVSTGPDGVSLVLDLEASKVAPEAWVPTPAPPVVPISIRAAVAVADDAVDQVLGAMWVSGEFDVAIASGSLTMRVPPAVSGTGLEIGDWILSGDGVEIAISGTVPLEALGDGNAVLLVAGEAELEAQILDGTTGDLDAVLEEAREALVGRITESLSILAIPVGEAVAPSLAVTADGGYLVIDTFIPPP
jgi:hypothetical protein